MREAGIVVVGGGMAGYSAIAKLRALGFDGSITLVGDEARMPYDRPPLSKSAIVQEAEATPAWLMAEGEAESLGLSTHLGIAATGIDVAKKAVRLSNGHELPYSRLLIATGASPRRLSVPGNEHVQLLRNFEDGIRLRQCFEQGRRIVIVGGGFIGLELAASASRRGCSVTIVEVQPRILMRAVPERIAGIVHDRHVAAGIVIITGARVAAIETDCVRLADGRAIRCDTVAAGIGAAPETRLGESARIAIENGIAVDATLKTSAPDIFAAGDCCSFPHVLFYGKRIRLEAWRNAREQGATAAENMLGAAKDHALIPWFWSDQFDLSLQIAGLPDLGSVTVERTVAPNTTMLFHLGDDGRLLGASGIGSGNAVARDIKLAEMLIAKGAKPDAQALASTSVTLKSLVRTSVGPVMGTASSHGTKRALF